MKSPGEGEMVAEHGVGGNCTQEDHNPPRMGENGNMSEAETRQDEPRQG